jgi:hypothetical protein
MDSKIVHIVQFIRICETGQDLHLTTVTNRTFTVTGFEKVFERKRIIKIDIFFYSKGCMMYSLQYVS